MQIHTPKELALAIKNQRKKLRLNQTELADLVGMKQATVSNFENNPTATKLATLFRILAASDLELHIQQRDSKNSNWSEEW